MRKWILPALLVVFLIWGMFAVRGMRAMPATTWMNIYDPSDFTTTQELFDFVRDLRVPVPVVMSVAEILNFQLAGDLDFTLGTLYQASLVLVYLLAILLSASLDAANARPWRMMASFVLSVIFLSSTILIHPGNPQPYDIAYPLLILLCIFCLAQASGLSAHSSLNLLFSVAAGLSLSLAELSRPFVILLLPVLIIATYLALRYQPRKVFLGFLVPILLLSGSWHLHQLVSHGQWSWSNHSGFNLWHAWALPMQNSGASLPKLVEEGDSQPLKPGRWPNLNNPQHAENNHRVQQAVLGWIVHHPLESLVFASRRLGVLMIKVKTAIYDHQPQSWLFWFYRPAVWVSGLYLFWNALLLGLGLLQRPVATLSMHGSAANQLILIAGFSILFLALGEAGEEARFLISVLPFLAVLQRCRLPDGVHIPFSGRPSRMTYPGYKAASPVK